MMLIFLLWILHAANLQIIVPFKVRDFKKPDLNAPTRRLHIARVAYEKEYPFMLLILTNRYGQPFGNRSICSASLIAREWVLTARHCFMAEALKAHNVLAVGGKVDLNYYASVRAETKWDEDVDTVPLKVQERRGKKLYLHPYYDPHDKNDGHDLALITVDQFSSKYVRPNAISFAKMTSKKTCTVLGYGMIGDGSSYLLHVIREIEVSTTSLGCHFLRKPNWICLDYTESSRICSGDSGSPLICDRKIWGVASFSIAQNESAEICGASKEDYYSELAVEKEWFVVMMTSSSSKTTSVHAKIFLFFLLGVIF